MIDLRTLKVSSTIATVIVTLRPGGLRELHWHPNADKWMFFIQGQARMTVFASGGRARTLAFPPTRAYMMPKRQETADDGSPAASWHSTPR